MKEEYIINFEELTDSRELLYSKPPLVMRLFIYLILLMLFIALIWLWFGKIDIVIKAQGLIRPVDHISVINNIISGNIKEINYHNGKLVDKGEVLYEVNTEPFERQKENDEKNLKDLKEKLVNLEKLQESIHKNQNFMSIEHFEYYNRFLVYQYQKENLELQYSHAKEEYMKNNSLPEGSISGMELKKLKDKVRFCELQLKKYLSETNINIIKEIDQLEKQIAKVHEQLLEINENIKYCQITAPIDGVVQETNKFNIDDYITAHTEILKIVPQKSSQLKVEVLVSNKDIAKVSEGLEIRYRFASLPYNEYGGITGKITNISSDISISQNSQEPAYLVDASLPETTLVNKKGSTSQVRIGMFCDTRIKVGEKKILIYLLEKLDFLT
ncbi:MAG: HlyD family secretion protein [Spirochaetes bacterium]|nr:HlyD family secretion protein [Spirochaetota bacterium]